MTIIILVIYLNLKIMILILNFYYRHIMTPLMYASQRGLSKLVKLFCEKGAAIDMQDSRGMTVSLILYQCC